MTNLFYYKYNASMFLNTSGFKVLSQILTKNTEWQFFDKDKNARLLIISSIKTFDTLLPAFSCYYYAWSTKM